MIRHKVCSQVLKNCVRLAIIAGVSVFFSFDVDLVLEDDDDDDDDNGGNGGDDDFEILTLNRVFDLTLIVVLFLLAVDDDAAADDDDAAAADDDAAADADEERFSFMTLRFSALHNNTAKDNALCNKCLVACGC
jgi:hypothetical protein